MYAINKKYGIGKVEEIVNGKVTVYFDEVDKRVTLLQEFVKIYETIEDAEDALNPELTEDDKVAILAKIEEDAEIMRKGIAAQHRLEEINMEASKKLKKYI